MIRLERELPGRRGDPLVRYYGKYRGMVSNNEDPKKIGRLKANVPEILFGEETGWALPALPYAGDSMGLYVIPPAGAGVWIEFEAGDVSRPIWTGCWWSEGQPPKSDQGDEATPALKILRSEEGLIVALDDKAKTITLSDADAKNLLTIKTQDGKLVVKAATKVIVEAPAIEIVESASHPVVFGDDLLKYLSQMVTTFNSHTHAGQVAGPYPVTPTPPASPMSAPQQTMLSTKVKAG